MLELNLLVILLRCWCVSCNFFVSNLLVRLLCNCCLLICRCLRVLLMVLMCWCCVINWFLVVVFRFMFCDKWLCNSFMFCLVFVDSEIILKGLCGVFICCNVMLLLEIFVLLWIIVIGMFVGNCCMNFG